MKSPAEFMLIYFLSLLISGAGVTALVLGVKMLLDLFK